MSQKSLNIALVGCGKMGQAMLKGWLQSDIAGSVVILDPAGIPANFLDNTIINCYENAAEFSQHIANADICVMAVKPQQMDDACKSIQNSLPENTLLLSIAAGTKISLFEDNFGSNRPIIRVMPNTPASIGKGISVATCNHNVTPQQKEIAASVLRATGLVEWLEEESLMDAVTALSGSGPAYVFLLIEAMAGAGEKAGLESAFAMKLARQTVIGSAALAEENHKLSAETLRKNVTSPGGTTEAALNILMHNDAMQELFDRAIKAATKRGKELAE